MISMNLRIIRILAVSSILGLVIFTGYGVIHADHNDMPTAVFFVT